MDRIRRIKHIALDMDGTIYNGNTLFPFTIAFLDKMKELGIGYSFLTNNPSKSTNDYLRHLSGMGIKAVKDEFYTSAQATIDYIRVHHPECKRLFLLGTPSMIKEFEEAGFESTDDNADDEPDAVVVSFDMSLVYSRLCRACLLYTSINMEERIDSSCHCLFTRIVTFFKDIEPSFGVRFVITCRADIVVVDIVIFRIVYFLIWV